jgi:DNA-binding transcriptional ArsR family regulator
MVEPDLGDVERCRALAVQWAPVLRALGSPDRLLIVLWLTDGAQSVRELQAVTGLPQSTVSYHLGHLRDAGLVTAEAEGRSNRYRLLSPDLGRVATLLGSLAPAAAEERPTAAPGGGGRVGEVDARPRRAR